MARIKFANHPYIEGGKHNFPMRIGKEQVGYFTYPDFDIPTSDLNTLYVSTPNLTLGVFELAAGSKFSPPDHHPGEELYYIAEGDLTEVNPISGQAVHVQQGEVLIIPREGAHGGYNFGNKRMKAVFALAPNMVADQTFPTDLAGKWRVLKGRDEESYKPYPPLEKKVLEGTINDIGRWPVPGEELRKDPKYLRCVTEKEKLNVINGLENPYLMKFAVSNDLIHFGEIVMPTGGVGCRVSDPEKHEGDTAIYVLEGKLSFIMMESRETFLIEKDEVMFIPAGIEYQMMNYHDEFVHAVFAIAPGL